MMYVPIIFYVYPLFTEGYYFSEPQNCELSGKIYVKMCLLKKAKKS